MVSNSSLKRRVFMQKILILWVTSNEKFKSIVRDAKLKHALFLIFKQKIGCCTLKISSPVSYLLLLLPNILKYLTCELPRYIKDF